MAFDFDFTVKHLEKIIGNNPNINHWYDAIIKICPEYGITTKKRLAAFLAQCAHESASFNVLRENFNYKAESLIRVFPKYFPNISLARKYANKPEKIANRVYSNRMGNRDEASGDGWKYIGRGLIQLTGKENYQWFAASIEMDVDDLPDYLSTFDGAVQSACFFWETNDLNPLADSGDIKGMTKKINGGYIGLADRIKHYTHALEVMGESV